MDHAPGFLVHTVILLAAAVVMVPIARRLSPNAVLGELRAGVLVGLQVLGAPADSPSMLTLPGNLQRIMHLQAPLSAHCAALEDPLPSVGEGL